MRLIYAIVPAVHAFAVGYLLTDLLILTLRFGV